MARSPHTGLWVVGGIVGVAGLALLAAGASSTTPVQNAARRIGELEGKAVQLVSDWITTLLRATAKHEGYYWSVNRNLDLNGVSYGILQWTQKSGSLYGVLQAMRAAAPEAFDVAFGGTTNALALLAHTRATNMGPLNGANLWDEPWLGRFRRAAGPIPTEPDGRMKRLAELPLPATPLQSAMYYYAASSSHMLAAIDIAKSLDVTTERGMVLCYNRTVHQGPGGAGAARDKVLALWAKDPATRPENVNDRLAQYAWRCARGFRSTTPRSGNYNASGTIVWAPVSHEQSELHLGDYSTQVVPVSNVWHGVDAGGKFGSYYDLIVRRSSEILLKPGLRDLPVDLGGLA